jgi:hypothetical protein
VAAGAGAALYLTTGEKAEPAKAAILPTALPGGAGLVATGRF